MAQTDGRAESLLTELYAAGAPLLDDYPWTFEGDRWVEMLVCVLIVDVGIDGQVARDAVDMLRTLNAISPDELAKASAEQSAFIERVLLESGFDVEEAAQARGRFTSLAKVVRKRWDGFLQKLLRSYGKKMAKDLTGALRTAGMGPEASAKISVLWLQNVANLPILLPSDPHISAFSKAHSLSESELVKTADRLGLNVAVMDDLLALEAAAASAPSEKTKARPKRNGSRAKRK